MTWAGSRNPPRVRRRRDPYSYGAWDVVFTGDDPYSRPDPYRGQLLPYGNFYAPTPLNANSFNPPPHPPVPTTYGSDVILTPLGQNNSVPKPPASNTTVFSGGATVATDYFYTFGNVATSGTFGGSSFSVESGSPSPSTPLVSPYPGMSAGTSSGTPGSTQTSSYATPNASTPSLIQTLTTVADPVTGPVSSTSPINIYQGVLPGVVAAPVPGNPNPSTTTLPANTVTKVPAFTLGKGMGPWPPKYYWVCLRRPANPFAPVSLNNPMVVVDSMRFPYFDGTANTTSYTPSPPFRADRSRHRPRRTRPRPPAPWFTRRNGSSRFAAVTPFRFRNYRRQPPSHPLRSTRATAIPSRSSCRPSTTS